MRVKAEAIKVAMTFTSTDDTRSIRGIHLFRNTVEATNGHILFRYTDAFEHNLNDIGFEVKPGETTNDAIILVYDVLSLEVSEREEWVNLFDGVIYNTVGTPCGLYRLLEETYPNCDAVIPRENQKAPVEEIAFDSNYLALLKPLGTVKFTFCIDNLTPCIFTSCDNPSMTGVIMPCHIS